MAFAVQLQESLQHRHSQAALELAAGESLEAVLGRLLLAVESAADTQLLTSILLLDGKRVRHGAAPSLPKSYCEAIDGLEIGPNAGSCGTAAYFGKSVYVTDVVTDPLWQDYRDLALQHGLRACWSTPILNADGKVIATFAIYHRTSRSPVADEVEAIRLITGHVAQAIEWAQARSDAPQRDSNINGHTAANGHLKLVSDQDSIAWDGGDGADDKQAFPTRLQTYAEDLTRFAAQVDSEELSGALEAVARDCRNLSALVARWAELSETRDSN